MLPDEQTSPEQFEVFRRMPPERRLALAERLYWSAHEMKATWLRDRHADWSEEQVLCDVRAMLAVSGDPINRAELGEWIRRRGPEAEGRRVCT